MGSDIHVEDGEDYLAGGEIGIKRISMEQYRKCCVEGSKEMTRGGNTSKLVNGQVITITKENQREIFINCVTALGVILTPEIIKSVLEKDIEEIEEKIKGLKEDGRVAYIDALKDRKQNEDTLKDYFELRLVDLNWEKVKVYSKLLKEINYYDEGTAHG